MPHSSVPLLKWKWLGRVPVWAKAARNIGKTAFELATGYLLLQDDYTAPVKPDEVERVLAEVDPDRGDDSNGLLRCAHRMLHELASRLPATVQQISR